MCHVLITKTYIEFPQGTKRKIIKGNAVLNKKQLQNERDRIKAEYPASVKVYFDYEEI